MASSENKNRAGSTACDVCNAESGSLKRSTVLRVLSRQRSTVENLQTMAGLSADHPCRFKRERWEFTCGKIVLLSKLANEIAALPDESKNLMGEKPFSSILPRLDSRIQELSDLRNHFRAEAFDPAMESAARGQAFHEWNRLDAAWHELSTLRAGLARLENSAGNAEEQPAPREESRAPIVEKHCDGARGESSPAFHPDLFRSWLESLDTPALSLAFESARTELESRGHVIHWSLTGY